MSESMVERVAKAIYDALPHSSGDAVFLGELQLENDFRGRRETTIDGHIDLTFIARAVIEAMRDLTEEMIAAGETVDLKYYCDGDPTTSHADVAGIHTAIVDSALKE